MYKKTVDYSTVESSSLVAEFKNNGVFGCF